MAPRWGGRRVAQLRALVLSTYPPVCRICRQRIDVTLPPTHPRGPSVGHVVPRSRGGTDDLSNLRPEHLECNVGLGNRATPGRRPRVGPGFLTQESS